MLSYTTGYHSARVSYHRPRAHTHLQRHQRVVSLARHRRQRYHRCHRARCRRRLATHWYGQCAARVCRRRATPSHAQHAHAHHYTHSSSCAHQRCSADSDNCMCVTHQVMPHTHIQTLHAPWYWRRRGHRRVAHHRRRRRAHDDRLRHTTAYTRRQSCTHAHNLAKSHAPAPTGLGRASSADVTTGSCARENRIE
jgi:hypothetical protein